MGQKRFMAVTETGAMNQMTAQATEVKKALLRMAKIVQARTRVVFEDHNDFIENINNGQKYPDRTETRIVCHDGVDPTWPEVPSLKASHPLKVTVRPEEITDDGESGTTSGESCTHRFEHGWRRSLFVPWEHREVGNCRVTTGTYEDGEGFVLSDYWRASKRPERYLSRKWRGRTEFRHSTQCQESEAPNSSARWLTPRSSVNSRQRAEVLKQ